MVDPCIYIYRYPKFNKFCAFTCFDFIYGGCIITQIALVGLFSIVFFNVSSGCQVGCKVTLTAFIIVFAKLWPNGIKNATLMVLTRHGKVSSILNTLIKSMLDPGCHFLPPISSSIQFQFRSLFVCCQGVLLIFQQTGREAFSWPRQQVKSSVKTEAGYVPCMIMKSPQKTSVRCSDILKLISVKWYTGCFLNWYPP